MYISKRSGCPVYETLEEIICQPITLFTEYGNNYYVQIKIVNPNDEGTIWVVDKDSERVSYYGGFSRYILDGMSEKATPINIEKFLNERKRKCS